MPLDVVWVSASVPAVPPCNKTRESRRPAGRDCQYTVIYGLGFPRALVAMKLCRNRSEHGVVWGKYGWWVDRMRLVDFIWIAHRWGREVILRHLKDIGLLRLKLTSCHAWWYLKLYLSYFGIKLQLLICITPIKINKRKVFRHTCKGRIYGLPHQKAPMPLM